MTQASEYYRDKVAVVTGGAGVAENRRLVLGDEGDVSGARTCFAPEAAEGMDGYLLDVARKRRQGEWVV